jgi:hypothetical protein
LDRPAHHKSYFPAVHVVTCILPFYLWLGYPCPQPLKVFFGPLVTDPLDLCVAFPEVFVTLVFHRWMFAVKHDMGLALVVVVTQGTFGFVLGVVFPYVSPVRFFVEDVLLSR